MTDCQELISRLRCQSECCGDCPMIDMELVEADHTHQVYEQRCTVHEAADAIEELQKQVPRWIPVTKRLPEVGEEVQVVAVYDFDANYKWVSIDWLNTDKQWQQHTIVTHWMPLPQPPKEET